MNKYAALLPQFQEVLGNKNVLVDEPMKNHTSFKVGGPVDILLTPEDYSGIQWSIKFCKKNNIPYFIIGNGSNLIVKDGGIRGVVIKLTKLDKILIDNTMITAQSGALLSDVSKAAMENSLTGFEFACGIPGCIGGAVAMNAGAYISEIKNVIKSALVIDNEGEMLELAKDSLELEYRNSIILKKGYTVLEAVFSVEKGEYNAIKDLVEDLQARRKDKQPLEYPSAGSTFKRPEGHFASKLIQDSNLKGLSVGGAQVSVKHSGFIINTGNATAKDILELIHLVQKAVDEKFAVKLHTEVRIIGEE